MNIQQAKARFGIIGNCPKLETAINVSLQVAPTDISILVVGESGTGKENIPKIIHQNSKRKHNPYISVNCGAIQKEPLTLNFLDMKKGHLLELMTIERAILNQPMKEQFF